jgi:hypothetical protein
MSDGRQPPHKLSAREMRVLKFAVRRQITRLGQQAQPERRATGAAATLQRVLHVLEGDAFADGCDLHLPSEQ